jgi:hypothetical protein
MDSLPRDHKKRKFDQTIDDEYEDGFPDDFNIEYSSNILNRDQSLELGQARKAIMTSFYKALDNGQPFLTIDLYKYSFVLRKQIINEILIRFPRINYILNVFGNKISYAITNNSNQMTLNECAKATEFIIPLSIETDNIDKIASYIS